MHLKCMILVVRVIRERHFVLLSPIHLKLKMFYRNLQQVNCTGTAEQISCVVVGKGQKTEDGNDIPLILQTSDAGNTWEKKKIPECKASNCWLNQVPVLEKVNKLFVSQQEIEKIIV